MTHMGVLHFWKHHLNAIDTKIEEWTESFWSKAWILRYLSTFPDLREHILAWEYISPKALESGSIPELSPDFEAIKESLIYRSTHPDDHRWYIGLLPTLLSRSPIKQKTLQDLWHKQWEQYKVYRALAYYQEFWREMQFPNPWDGDGFAYHHWDYAPPSNRCFLAEDWDWVINETDEEIPMDQYRRLLKWIQESGDTTDYSLLQRGLLWIWSSKHIQIIESIRNRVFSQGGFQAGWLRSSNLTGIYIQPEIIPNGSATWGITESPHSKWVYIITFRNPSLKSEKQRNGPEAHHLYEFDDHPSSIIYDSNTWETIETCGYGDWIRWYLGALIELYKKVEAKKIFWEEYSFHMEFWFQGGKPLIYQIRQFGAFQKPTFSLSDDPRVPFWQIVRWITDETWQKISFLLSWRKWWTERNAHIFVNPKIELQNPTIRDKVFAWVPFWHRINDDHGITTLLFETGWVGVSWGLTTDDSKFWRDTWVFEAIAYSDGMRVKLENIERVS